MVVTHFSVLKQGAIACLLSALMLGASVQAEQVETIASPYSIAVFKSPEKYRPLLKEYRGQWPSLSGIQYSGLHWNQFIAVYSNSGAAVYENNHKQFLRWYDDPDDEENEPQYLKYPVGTVLLKENYAAEDGHPGAPLSLTMMIKQAPGFSSGHGDWLFLQTSTAGDILIEGSFNDPEVKAVCADCHENVADRDYIFSSMYTSYLTLGSQE